MLSVRFKRLTHFVLGVLLALAAVNPTVPDAFAHPIAESAPATDDDLETEFVAPASARQSPAPQRRPSLFAAAVRAPDGDEVSPRRVACGARVRSIDPLGTRLRC